MPEISDGGYSSQINFALIRNANHMIFVTVISCCSVKRKKCVKIEAFVGTSSCLVHILGDNIKLVKQTLILIFLTT